MNEKNQIDCSTCGVRCNSIFKDLNHIDLEKLNELRNMQFYKKGQALFNEGSYPRGLYCVKSGKIKVSQEGLDGKDQIVYLISDGDVMGHRAILGDDQYSCSAIAMEDSHVCFIPKNPFYTMVQNNPKLALNIAHLLANELKEAEQKITATAQRPVKDRLAQAILFLKKNYGVENDNATISVEVKRLDLANLAGTTRETATRFLHSLQEQKILELIGKKIKIIDEQKIVEIAFPLI